MYIGGGKTEGSSYYKVLEYTIQGSQWREIETPVYFFGMAVVNDQLIFLGGWILLSLLIRCGYWRVTVTRGHSHSLQCLQLDAGSPQWATRGGCWRWGDMRRGVWRY